jgi:hypothetical protein
MFALVICALGLVSAGYNWGRLLVGIIDCLKLLLLILIAIINMDFWPFFKFFKPVPTLAARNGFEMDGIEAGSSSISMWQKCLIDRKT